MHTISIGYRSLLSFLSTTIISACAGPQFREQPDLTPVVPISAVVDSLKCGLSNALAQDFDDRSGIRNAKAVVQLDVNVIGGTTLTGSASAGIPIAAGAGSFSPSIGASANKTLTTNTTTDFEIVISRGSSKACGAVAGKYRDAGFSTWMTAMVKDTNLAVAGPPYASMQKYIYDSNFVLKRGVNGGADFDIVPVKLGATFDTSRSDVQHINISISPIHTIKGKQKPGGRQYEKPID